MKYEYKAVTLVGGDENLSDDESEKLNEMFDAGWEYVDSISQTVASGGGNYTNGRRGSVIVVLRKENNDLTI